MWILRRPPSARFKRVLNTAGRAAAAALLLAVSTLAAPSLAAPIMAAPALAAPVPAGPPLAPQGCAPTWVVTTATDNVANSLRDAVNGVCLGGIVTFAPALAGQTIHLTSGEIHVFVAMTIDGSAAPGVKVDAGNTSRVFNITASGTVTLTGLVLQRGLAASGNGGAVLTTHALTLNQVQVLSSTASAGEGGGLFVGSSALLSGTQFISNTAGFSAGGAWVNTTAVVIGGRFERNICLDGSCQGGGLNTSGLTLSGTVFIDNFSQNHGGAVYADSAAALTNGLFQENQCSGSGCFGGGLYANFTLALTGTQFISNTSLGDGGGANSADTALLTNGLFQGNQCDDPGCRGGGLFANSTLTLSGTQFVGNSSDANGGGAYAGLAAVLTSGRFQDNHCNDGDCVGGGLSANTSLTLAGTQFIGNISGEAGGGAAVVNAAVLTNGLFQGNHCFRMQCLGGGLIAAGLTLTGTHFLGNNSGGGGGGAYIGSGGGAVVTNGLFQDNGCGGTHCTGGGLYAAASLALTGTQFIHNTSRGDGGGAIAGSPAWLTSSHFERNQCTNDTCSGGGLSAPGLTLTGTQFISNTSLGEGGGAYIPGSAQVTNGRFQGNQCTLDFCQGGGLRVSGGLTLIGSQMISNTSGENGGGAYAGNNMTVYQDDFESNRCGQSDCLGGGLFAGGGVDVHQSSFSANHAAGKGGALVGSFVTLANVTLAGNSASVAGGALFADTGTTLNLYNVSLANNLAADGAGLWADPAATVGVSNTLFANNAIHSCSGPIASGTHNLEWPGNDCATAGPGAGFTTADPQFLPLALNPPGSTLTLALGPLSPARDHGDAATCAGALVNNEDQRGVIRPLNSDMVAGAICDIGAFEAGAPVWQVFLPVARR